ncbi:DUF5700 domain-containing putative Zn-dependent protease [Thermohalobacter berrensis]|uniref:DUF2268 domain-containing protein n=1 Tax=Thermohalobacter berrensis TaxID=99594 RepID=A0A419T8W7_9FIRM|nr:DUF5700 domain-containing putative Zn-dependent protease [Thermohalobacter berrensis]RKD33913.1 hypothetical protein BET03_08270 [Thermohalobacter berrensis]
MISINLNVEGAQLMLDLFKTARDEEKIDEKIVSKIINLKVMDYLVKHYNIPHGSNANITKSDVHRVLTSITNKEFTDKNNFLVEMHKNYRQKFDNLENYEGMLKKINKSNISNKAEDKLKDFVPGELDLKSTVYIIFTGKSGGYFNGEDITLDLGYITESMGNKFVNVIAHELHHIGYNKIYQSVVDEEKMELKDRLIFSLLSGLIGEGIAYYCVGGIPKEGEQGYNDFLSDVKKEKEHFKDLNNTLKDIISGNIDSEEKFMKWVSKHMSQTFGAINYVGIKTVEAIFNVFGNKGIIDIMKHPNKFISKYNQAASKLNNEGKDFYIFDNDIQNHIINLL